MSSLNNSKGMPTLRTGSSSDGISILLNRRGQSALDRPSPPNPPRFSNSTLEVASTNDRCTPAVAVAIPSFTSTAAPYGVKSAYNKFSESVARLYDDFSRHVHSLIVTVLIGSFGVQSSCEPLVF